MAAMYSLDNNHVQNLYPNDRWTIEMDYDLLDGLLNYSYHGAYDGNQILDSPCDPLKDVAYYINNKHTWDYSYGNFEGRLDKLRARFRRCCRLIEERSVKWDMITNKVSAPTRTWEVLEMAGRWEAGDVGNIRPKSISDFHRKLRGDPYYMQITLDQLISKLFEWQGRHRRFKRLIDDPRTDFDRDTYKVTAPSHVWESLQPRDPLVGCYMEKGELNWPLMRIIFEPPTESSTSNDRASSSREALLSLSVSRWGPCVADSGSTSNSAGSPEF